MFMRLILSVCTLLLAVAAFFGLNVYNKNEVYGELNKTLDGVVQLSQRWVFLQQQRARSLAEDSRVTASFASPDFIDLNAMRRALYEFSYAQKLKSVFVYSPELEEKLIYPATSQGLSTPVISYLQNHMTNSVGPLMRLVENEDTPEMLVAMPIYNAQEIMVGLTGFVAPIAKVLQQHSRPVLRNLPEGETLIMDEHTTNGPLVVMNAFNNQAPTLEAWQQADIPNLRHHTLRFFSIDEPRLIVGNPLKGTDGWWTLLTVTQQELTSRVTGYYTTIGSVVGMVLILLWIGPFIRLIKQTQAELKAGAAKRAAKKAPPKDPNAYLDYRDADARRKTSDGKRANAGRPIQRVRSPERLLADTIEKSLRESRTRLLFQPIFDVYTYEAVMCEVFLRIEDDDGNIMTPDKFIPIAQRYRLLPKIDAHVVSRVVDEYLAPGKTSVPLAVNLGGGTFESIAFLQTLMNRIQPAWSSNLVLELRSQEIIRDVKAMDFIHNCRKLGCRFSIDYFGGGTAMLSGTKRMNFNFLKVDSLAFQGAEDKKELIRLGRAAQDLKLPLVLERVETEADVLLAQKIGIPYVQGYFLAIPSDKLDY